MMKDKSENDDLDINSTLDPNKNNLENKESQPIDPKFGVQHDEKGNVIKVAENAVPPDAWKNQKKAYSDAWENNKNQVNDDL